MKGFAIFLRTGISHATLSPNGERHIGFAACVQLLRDVESGCVAIPEYVIFSGGLK
jgi:hypothetical protein